MSTIAQKAARNIVTIAAALDTESRVTTYIGGAGDVTTVGFIDLEADLFGGETLTSEKRYVARLLVEDVGHPFRGDRIMDENNTTWILQEERPTSDLWITEWSITRQ